MTEQEFYQKLSEQFPMLESITSSTHIPCDKIEFLNEITDSTNIDKKMWDKSSPTAELFWILRETNLTKDFYDSED